MIPLVVGDSLTVGATPYMHHVRVDARVGRSSAEGARRLRRHGRQHVLVWALGTNDSYPTFRHNLAYARRLTKVLVLTTVYGVPAAHRENLLMRRTVPTRCIVPWAAWARNHRRQLAGDGIHGTARAYRARARMTQHAINVC